MAPVSVVIITHNEEANIAACIQSAKLISNDIIIVDAGSSDATVELAKEQGAKVVAINWYCYGASKNKGTEQARYDWIFSLDADERITPQLAQSIQELNFNNDNCVYQFSRVNYLGDKKLKFGTAGFDKVIRIYNRRYTEWDLTPVHEKLTGKYTKKKLKGALVHYSTQTLNDYKEKVMYYAKLSAQKYFEQNKKAGLVKRFVAPLFDSFKSYIFHLGFLEGKTGYKLAGTIAYYTWLKYQYLHRLHQQSGEEKMNSVSHTKTAGRSAIAFLRK